MSPRVSVIMPAFNHSLYIGEAIQSILNQTYADWELIIVDDGSTDSTADAVAQFDDPRIRLISQTNKGVSEARNVAIQASGGEYLAFLDADDLFHPGNLESQVSHLDRDPEIGATYVSRIEIDQDGNRLRFHRSPQRTTLKELIVGFPFSPSDFMIRRLWIEKAGPFNRSYIINEDRDFFLRLAFEGCQFAGVDRFFAYRRFYAGRTFPNLPAKLNDRLRVLDAAFTDPRCPVEILALKNLAHRNIYLEWAYQASVNGETALAQEYFRETLRYDPSMFEANQDELSQRLFEAATRNGGEHETRLRMAYANLPVELKQLTEQLNWAVSYGYLHRGVRDLMWDRAEQANANLSKAVTLGAQLDPRSLRMLRYQLLSYDAGLGREIVHAALRRLSPYLKKIGGRKGAHRLYAWYAFMRALRSYQEGEFASAAKEALRAVSNSFEYVRNRQLRSILIHSIRAILFKL